MHSQRFQRGYVPIFLSYYKPHMKLFILDMCCANFLCKIYKKSSPLS